MELPEAFLEQMQSELGAEAPAFFSTYNEESAVGLRACARKGWQPPADFEPVPWCAQGFYVPRGLRPGKDPLHAAGAYYLQEPSAMAPVEALSPRPGQRVLDLCAAPGGKSTQLADKLRGQGILVTNEIHPARARILLENIERMGVDNALVLNETPARIAAHFEGYFDAVLVDAPCSGEGMFRRDPQAVLQWRADAPQACHARQTEILDSAARCVCGGGTLVYSTCTYNRLENERTIAVFLQRHPDFYLDESLRLPGVDCAQGMAHLYPHKVRGEGHFLARLTRKSGPARAELPPMPPDRPDVRCTRFMEEALRGFAPRAVLVRGEWAYALPDDMPDFRGLKVLRAGVQLGRLAAGRMEPAHALALALRPDQFVRTHETTREAALGYLRGEVLPGEEIGWCAVTYGGLGLGWGKGSGGQIKNHLPKGLRWRPDKDGQ